MYNATAHHNTRRFYNPYAHCVLCVSSIWSYGVMLYSMLTGVDLFQHSVVNGRIQSVYLPVSL